MRLCVETVEGISQLRLIGDRLMAYYIGTALEDSHLVKLSSCIGRTAA